MLESLAVGSVLAIVFCVMMFLAPLGIWNRLIKIHRDQLAADARRAEASAHVLKLLREIRSAVYLNKTSSVSGKIRFACPDCGAEYEGDNSMSGTDTACSKCNTLFHIH